MARVTADGAAAVSDMQDTHEDLYSAFDACGDVDESDAWPYALDGANPSVYVDIVCGSHPAVKQSGLCGTLGS